MTTVNSLMLQLALRVDPRAKETGGVFTESTVGTVDGKYPKQRLLDIYNQARTMVFNALVKQLPMVVLTRRLSGLIVSVSPITFGNFGGVSKTDLPADCVKVISLSTSTGLVPMRVLPSIYVSKVLNGEHNYKQTASKIMVFEEGRTLRQYVNSGGTMYTGNALLTYFGLSNWILADVVLATTKNETFNLELQPNLIDFAEGLSANVGAADMTNLIEKLLLGVK